MRSFRSFAARRPISVLCVLLLLVPICSTLMLPVPAAAQSEIIQATVVDFRNTSKVPNEMFGSMATDAVVVELLRSGKFGVTTAEALQASMEALGYKAKGDRSVRVLLTPAMMVRLGQECEANCVISGEVTSINIDPEKKKADVRLVVRMLDVASGEFVNGAVATGSSYPRIGYTADKDTDWVIEAINNAARKAVETMVKYIIPEATVIGTVGTNEAILNKGSQEGLEEGMELIALRRGEGGIEEVVARLRVTAVTDTDARAVVISATRGIQPQDRVRAVYDLPSDTQKDAAPRTDTQKRIKKGSKLLWGLGLLIGLGLLFKGGGDEPEQVPDAVVMAGKSPEITSRVDDGGILVAWKTPKGIAHANIIEYHVWRDNIGSIGSTGSGSGNIGPVRANDFYTALPYSGPAGYFDHSLIDDITTVQFDYQVPDADTHELAERTQDAAPPIIPSTLHHYWISCVYKRLPSKSEDEGGVITYWETTPAYAGCATYLQQRPELVYPGDITGTQMVDLSEVRFDWKGCRKADLYQIEVSTSPEFIRDQTWVKQVYQPVTQDGQFITRTFTNELNTCPELRNVQPGQMLYWRVGARNSQDRPGPVPAGPTPTLSGSKNTRYIYSDPHEVFMFMKLETPDLPPDTGGGDDGGDGDSPPPIPS